MIFQSQPARAPAVQSRLGRETRARLQRKCACGGTPGPSGECDECRKKRLPRKAANSVEPTEVPPIVHEVLRSPGQLLDRQTRAFMESHFGHDFSQVRVHTDAQAAESTRAVNALAYTFGHNVVFGAGKYAPQASAGQQLLAHELTHVVQQEGQILHLGSSSAISGVGDPAEREAEQASDAALHGHSVEHMMSVPAGIYRQPGPNRFHPGQIVSIKIPVLKMATKLGGSELAAILKKGDRLKLGEMHPQGGGNVFWATVFDAREKKYNERQGIVRVDWITEGPTLVLPEAVAGPEGEIEVDVITSPTVMVESAPDYIDGKVYAVGVRLMDQTYHLFIEGRERPLTIPAAWFGNQIEPVNTTAYTSRESALQAIGTGSGKFYVYWKTDEGYILPTHFGASSTPRINALSLGSLEEAAKYGKEVFNNILIGMIAGKSIEMLAKGAGYVLLKLFAGWRPRP